MKKIFAIISILLVMTACTVESVSENNTSSISVSSIIRKNYNTATGEVINTRTTSVVNNKIQSITAINQNGQQSLVNYNYVNNNISLIETFRNGILFSKNHYIYDSDNKLIEYRTEAYDNLGQIAATNKNTFNRIQGIIYSEWTRNSLTSPIFIPISSSEMVLDLNLNQTYFKEFDHLNNEFKEKETQYDANYNIIKEEYFVLGPNGVYVSTLTNNYTYGTGINTLSFINLQSIGKENMMLLYHLNSNAINEFNVISVSPNQLMTFNSTFSPDITFAINNQTNSDNYSLTNEFITLISNVLFARFDYEYLYN